MSALSQRWLGAALVAYIVLVSSVSCWLGMPAVAVVVVLTHAPLAVVLAAGRL